MSDWENLKKLNTAFQYRSLDYRDLSRARADLNYLDSYLGAWKEMDLLDANDNRVKATFGMNYDARIGVGTSWIIAKLTDIFGDERVDSKCEHSLKIALDDIIRDGMKFIASGGAITKGNCLIHLIKDLARYCIIDEVAYENIDPIFQKYLEKDVSKWLVYIINDSLYVSGIDNLNDFIYDVLNLDREQLKRIEKKSVFNGSSEYIVSKVYRYKSNIETVTKSKDYFAIDSLVNKFNREINGVSVLTGMRQSDEAVKSYDDTNKNYASEIKGCGDEFIKGVLNKSDYKDNVSMEDICSYFNISILKFMRFYHYYQLGVVKSIYLGILCRLMYGNKFIQNALSSELPNVMLYNYFILEEHKGVLEYTDNPKEKVIELLNRHKKIINSGIKYNDMAFLYNIINEKDIMLLKKYS